MWELHDQLNHPPLNQSISSFPTASNAALIIHAFIFTRQVPQSGNYFCWIDRYMQFLFTQITFTKSWNSYFHWSWVRGPPTLDPYQFLLSYQTNVFHSYFLFLSLGRSKRIFPDISRARDVSARDDSSTLTMGRAETWVWNGAQMKGIEKKVKDGGCFISCNLEEYLLYMGIGSAFHGPYYLLFELEASSVRNELSA